MTISLDECVKIIYDLFCSMIYNMTDQFKVEDIIITSDLIQSVKNFGLDDDVSNSRGVTIPLSTEIKVVVLSDPYLYSFSSIVFHELIHVKDILWFKNHYNIERVKEHPLFTTLHGYSEYNAYKYGALGAVAFTNFCHQMTMEDYYVSKEEFRKNLENRESKVYSIIDWYKMLAEASLLDDHFQCQDYVNVVFSLFASLFHRSETLRKIYLQCQSFPPQLEDLDLLVQELFS